MNHEYPTNTDYLPQKNLLLISCIDLRLTDDLVRFMNHENLTNRYDHFILAGASLGATLGSDLADWLKPSADPKNNPNPDFSAWWKVLQEHIKIAVTLHQIKDVYIVEHERCGAYATFVKSEQLQQGEICCQEKSAWLLAEQIKQLPYGLHVHCFRMDLRGNVRELKHPAANC